MQMQADSEVTMLSVHRSFQTKETPTRTSVKLSSANWDIKVTMLWDAGVSSFLCCLSLISSSLSVSLEVCGMLLTCSRRILSPAHSGEGLFTSEGSCGGSALWSAVEMTGRCARPMRLKASSSQPVWHKKHQNNQPGGWRSCLLSAAITLRRG